MTADARPRCFWCLGEPEYDRYHDEEWGFPVADDVRLFEKISLEAFQSGLSWRTILMKREGFRAAFTGFDLERVARFTDADVERLLGDAGIVRHRGKIEATIRNARAACALIEAEGSLARYVWRHEPPAEERPSELTEDVLRALSTSPASKALSKDLKKRGWAFVGPTTVYAFLQAAGVVNDHTVDCFVRPAAEAARARFTRP